MKVRPIEQARVYSPTAANRGAFAEAMGHELGIRVQPVASAEEAVRGADIVASCTDSMVPTIRPEWLSPGMHVTNVGPYEIDQECLARFDVKIRQGEAGSGSEALRESDRLRREVGQSPLAYVAGTEAEMQRLPPRPPGRAGFGGNFPHIAELINGERQGQDHHPTRSPSITTSEIRASSSRVSEAWCSSVPRRKVWAAACRTNGSCRPSGIEERVPLDRHP